MGAVAGRGGRNARQWLSLSMAASGTIDLLSAEAHIWILKSFLPRGFSYLPMSDCSTCTCSATFDVLSRLACIVSPCMQLAGDAM